MVPLMVEVMVQVLLLPELLFPAMAMPLQHRIQLTHIIMGIPTTGAIPIPTATLPLASASASDMGLDSTEGSVTAGTAGVVSGAAVVSGANGHTPSLLSTPRRSWPSPRPFRSRKAAFGPRTGSRFSFSGQSLYDYGMMTIV